MRINFHASRLLVTTALAAVVVALPGCSGYAREETREAADAVAADARAGANKAADSTRDAAGKLADATKEAAGHVADATQDAARRAAESTRDVAGKTADKTREVGGGALPMQLDTAQPMRQKRAVTAGSPPK